MRSCLIVDAGRGTDSAVYGFLRQRRFDIKQATSIEEALAMCRAAMPDVIVYDDTANSRGKGIEFLRRLRRARKDVEPVVLYCSDDTDLSALGAVILSGASECLVKPFDDDLLEFKLRQAGIGTGIAA